MNKFKEYFKIIEKIYSIKDVMELQKRMKRIKHFNEFIYKDNDLVGGLTLFHPMPFIYFIEQVVIKPKYQGKGYGIKLMKRLNKYKGLIFLGCYSNLVKFYNKLGYKTIFSYMENKKICIMYKTN